jgi:type I restriction enzyme S subunit
MPERVPDGWKLVPIASVATLESGHTPTRRNPAYWDGAIPWVSLHDSRHLDAPTIVHTERSVTPLGIANSSARVLPAGTVVFSRTATVGKSTLLGRDMATSQDFANYVCGPRLHNRYLLHLFRFMQPEWSRLMAGSTHNTIYMPVFESLQVMLPPKREQRAIADALSDVDALLDSLDALIGKKRDIKQATMQQLLTGKTRLPGCNGEWRSVTLGNHVTFLRTGTNSRAELTDGDPVKYLHYGDIHTSGQVYLDPGETRMPSLPEERAHRLDRLHRGDLVLVDASEDLAGVGKSVEVTGTAEFDIVAGLHTIAARFDKAVMADGFKGYLQFCPTFRSQLRRLAAGTKVYATSRSHIQSVEMLLPDTQEQFAIATVLADMDAEIAALERRRAKTRDIKQGMMQQLLTGRIRLGNSSKVETST